MQEPMSKPRNDLRCVYRSYKTEIAPNEQQVQKKRQNMGVCRFLYNEYINMNIHLYDLYKKGMIEGKHSSFMSGLDFDKYVNRELKPQAKYAWIAKCGSKARKKAIMNADSSYRKYLNLVQRPPRFKKKHGQAMKLYFPRSNKTDWYIERHYVKIPTLGKVRLKEYGYLPQNADVVSGTVSLEGGRFFVSVLIRYMAELRNDLLDTEISIRFDEDTLIRGPAVELCSIMNIPGVCRLQKSLRRQKHSLQRKKENQAYSAHMEEQRRHIEQLLMRLKNIFMDYIYKLAAQIAAQRPSRITIYHMPPKDRSISKDARLKKLRQLYYIFTEKISQKAYAMGIKVNVIEADNS